MELKLGDIVKLYPVEETMDMKYDLKLYGLNYTEDSEFEVMYVDEGELLEGQRYLVNGTNGENDEWNEGAGEYASKDGRGFWIATMHVAQ